MRVVLCQMKKGLPSFGHDAAVVGADIEPAYVVAHDDDDIGFLFLRLEWPDRADKRSRGCQQGETVTDYFWFIFHWFLGVVCARRRLFCERSFASNRAGNLRIVSSAIAGGAFRLT